MTPTILQDVLVIVSRKLHWLEQPELFRAWAFRIASRAAFRHLAFGLKALRRAHASACAENRDDTRT